MKTMHRIAALLVAATGMGGVGLYAQNAVVMNVPFDFNVKAAKLPAGRYEMTKPVDQPNTIQISSLSDGRTILLVSYQSTVTEPGAATKAIFNHYGDRYFFSELWTSDGVESRVPPSKLEREVRASAEKNHTQPVTIAVAGTK